MDDRRVVATKKQDKKKQQQDLNKVIKRSSSLQDDRDSDYVDPNIKFKSQSKGRVPVKMQTLPQDLPKKPSSEPKPRLDLSRRTKEDRENFENILRIRDPVTSKVRTINLKDTEIDELARRHEEEKNRVNRLMHNQDRHVETEKEASIIPESYRSTQQPPPPQHKKPTASIDNVEDLINRHQQEKLNAQQIKADNEINRHNETLDSNRNPKHNLNSTQEHFDDIEI